MIWDSCDGLYAVAKQGYAKSTIYSFIIYMVIYKLCLINSLYNCLCAFIFANTNEHNAIKTYENMYLEIMEIYVHMVQYVDVPAVWVGAWVTHSLTHSLTDSLTTHTPTHPTTTQPPTQPPTHCNIVVGKLP